MNDPLEPTAGKTLEALLEELRRAAVDREEPSISPDERGLVVLCDLGVESGKTWRVEHGDLVTALRAINPSCAITADIPLGEGDIAREGDRSGLFAPGRNNRGEKNALRRLDPASIAMQFPIVARLIAFRGALTTMIGPLGSVISVRKLFESLVGDAANRRTLRAKLGYPEGFGFDAEALVTGAHGAIVAGIVERFERLEVTPGETYLDRLMRELVERQIMSPEPEEINVSVRRCCQALFLQLLHPAWESEGVYAGTLRRIAANVDITLSGWVDVILHHPEVRSLELALRALDRLAGETAFDLFQCSRAELLSPPRALQKAIAGLAPRVICAMHVVDPRREIEIEALEGWISRAAALGSVFLADAPVELAMPLGDSVTEAWAALSAPEVVGRFALLPQRRRARLPYGGWLLPVREFNYEETIDGQETAYLGASAAAFLAPAVAARPAGQAPWIGYHAVPGGETALLDRCEHSPEPIDVLALFPAPPEGDDTRRHSLGLIDLRAMIGPGYAAILAPTGVLERLSDGRFAKTTGPSPLSASPRPVPPGDPPRSE